VTGEAAERRRLPLTRGRKRVLAVAPSPEEVEKAHGRADRTAR
jgi:hypothetical protein